MEIEYLPMLCCSKSVLDFETLVWKVLISLPSNWPNLLNASLCHESYFKVTLD